MKRILHKAIVVVGVILIACPALYGQPLTDAQRLERCRTISKNIDDKQERYFTLRQMLRKKGVEQEFRDQYEIIHAAINNARIVEGYQTKAGRQSASSYYNLSWDNSWDTDIMAFQKALRKRLGDDIKELSKYDRKQTGDEIRRLEAEVAKLADNYQALGCGSLITDKKEGIPEQEPVKLVKDELDQKEPVKLKPIDQQSSGNEESQKTKELGEEQNQIKTDKAAIGWTGTWEGPNTTVTISGSQNSISAEFDYQVSDSKGTGGRWETCKVSSGMLWGKYAECKWTVQHEDKSKKGRRSGRLEVELKGDEITGTYYEDEPEFTYNEAEGYTKENVHTSMHKGSTWPIALKRKKGN